MVNRKELFLSLIITIVHLTVALEVRASSVVDNRVLADEEDGTNWAAYGRTFSESHFGKEADLWVGIYIRDLVNTHIRLLLHFM